MGAVYKDYNDIPIMSSITFPSAKAHLYLAAMARVLKERETCITYSPTPKNATVTITVFPDWEEGARKRNSVAGRREVIRFTGVSNIKVTTQDTLTTGMFERMEYSFDGNTVVMRVILKGIDGVSNLVEFTFSRCIYNPKGI